MDQAVAAPAEDKLARERERQKARRDYLKNRRRCVRCAKQDAYTINGRSLCAECEEKNRDRFRRYREQNRETICKREKARYEERKEKGICTQCGRPKEHSGPGPYCKRCMAMRRKTDRRNYGSNLLKCRHCENMPDPGSAYCSECKEKLSERMKTYWEKVRAGERERPIRPIRQKYGGIV